MGMNTKLISYSQKMKLSPKIKSSVFGGRKTSTQTKKMHKITLSPSNRTLLKPRKSTKYKIKSINSSRINLLKNQEEYSHI